MRNLSKKIHNSALTAGISLVIMMFLAFYAFGYVNSQLIVEADSVATLNNIIISKGLFLSGIISWVFIIITDILVTVALFIFLKGINRRLSLIGAAFRFIYTIFLILAVSQLFKIFLLVNQNPPGIEELAVMVDALLISFNKMWSFGLIIFGAHLFMLGYISYQSALIPKIISILLIIAGISYSLIHILNGFVPQMESITHILEMILTIPMTVGEIGFGIWLLIKGRKLEQVI